MPVETPATPNASHRHPALPWWQRTVPAPTAAAVVGATVLGGAAVLLVAQAWSEAPKPLAEATHVVGGMIVALLVVAACVVGTRTRALGDLVVAAAFSLAAHGASVLIQGASAGLLFVALAPVVAALGHLALLPTPIAPAAPTSDRIDIAWAIAKSRRTTARAAARAASPSHLAMHA